MIKSKRTIKLLMNNEAEKEKLKNILHFIKDWQLVDTEDKNRPDLMIVELGNDKEKDIYTINAMLKADEADEIFLTSETTDTPTLMNVMRIGVKEFISQPINTEEVEQALERFKERRKEFHCNDQVKSGKIMSFLGSKGGVGTTTVAVNLAVSMEKIKKCQSVALLDLNTLFGEIPLFLEITPKFNWGDITDNIDRLDNTFLMNTLSKHSSGLHILPSPAYLNGHQSSTPDIIERILSLMKSMFDYVIVDLGQSTDDSSLKVMQMSNSVFLISILNLPCLANTNRLMKSFVDLGYVSDDAIKVILNRYIKKSEITLTDVKESINREIFWVIPNDYSSTMSAINNGKPLMEIAPKSKISNSLLGLAKELMPFQEEKPKKRMPLLSLFKGMSKQER